MRGAKKPPVGKKQGFPAKKKFGKAPPMMGKKAPMPFAKGGKVGC